MKVTIIFLSLVFMAFRCSGFDLFTHLWISQQVLNDVIQKRSVTLNLKTYTLTDEVRNALIKYPSEFRMGTLGPDVFPDPIVGQITAHPGLPGGWKTDDWIQHLLNTASTPDEVAFAYGYACHAAMDVFAHTYVNAYAGDIFLLTDGELDVETRHFALEKYIGMHMPPLRDYAGKTISDYSSLIKAPRRFIINSLILNDKITSQYLKSGSLHLVAMNTVYNTVDIVSRETQKIVGSVAETYLNLLKEQHRLVLELDKKIGLTKQLELNFKLTEAVLKVKTEENKLLLKKLELEKGAIESAINTIADIELFVAQKQAYLIDANNLIGKLEQEIISLTSSIAKLSADILLLPTTIAKTVSERVCDFIFIPGFCGFPIPKPCNMGKEICKQVSKVIQIANPAIEALTSTKNQLIDKVAETGSKIVSLKTEIANTAIALKQKADEKVIQLKRKATSEANVLLYQGQKIIIEKELEIAQSAYDAAKALYEEAKKGKEELEGVLDNLVNIVIKKAVDLAKQYNALNLFFTKWKDDIKSACDAYVETGQRFALAVIRQEGNGLSNYIDWYKCWKPVFTGIPSEIPQAVCKIEGYYNTVTSQIDKILLEDLGVLGWLLVPSKKLEQEIKKTLKPTLEKAATDISNVVLGPTFTQFFNLVSAREAVTRAKFIEIYRRDGSGKNLLTFPDVTSIVDEEIGLVGGAGSLDPEKFATLSNAITLSKMTLLPGSSLNQIYYDYLGSRSTMYGSKLFPDNTPAHFTLLYKAISVIDGSGQWMNTALPLYRGTNFDEKWPEDRRYGYSRCTNEDFGFRFWVDPKSRKKIFPALFKGPLYPSLYAFAQSNVENSRFIPCAKNPFPNTETKSCGLLLSDKYCSSSWLVRLFIRLFGEK